MFLLNGMDMKNQHGNQWKKDDPIPLAKYADAKGLTDQVKWKWSKSYTKHRKVLLRRARNILKEKS